MEIPLLYCDNFLAVINKPAGIMVENDLYDHPSVMGILHKQLNPLAHKNFFVQNIHRLDRPVSGALVVAFKPSIVKKLNDSFRSHEVQKKYVAVTRSAPPHQKATIHHWLWKDQKNWRSEVRDAPFGEARPVSLSYILLAENKGKFLLGIELHSGKYHQIRAQLAHIGCAIWGDEKYGGEVVLNVSENAQIALHACSLTFRHPARGNYLYIKAPPPETIWWQGFRYAIETF